MGSGSSRSYMSAFILLEGSGSAPPTVFLVSMKVFVFLITPGNAAAASRVTFVKYTHGSSAFFIPRFSE